MTLSVKAKVFADINFTLSQAPNADGIGAATQSVNPKLNPIELLTGFDVGEIQEAWYAEHTLAASASESLDLSGGLTDAFGNTITFTAIKGILVIADDDNVNTVVVGGAASNPFSVGLFSDPTDKIVVRPGGRMVWVAPNVGATVSAGTGDILKIANGGGGTGVSYKIVLLGITS